MSNVVHLHDFRAKSTPPVTVMVSQLSSGKNPQFLLESTYFGNAKIKLNTAPEQILQYLKNLNYYVIVVKDSLSSSNLCEALHEANIRFNEVHDDLFQGIKSGKYKAALEHIEG